MRYSVNSVWVNEDGYDVAVIGAGMQAVRRRLLLQDLVSVRSYLRSVWTVLR